MRWASAAQRSCVPRTRSTGRRLLFCGGTATRDYALAGVELEVEEGVEVFGLSDFLALPVEPLASVFASGLLAGAGSDFFSPALPSPAALVLAPLDPFSELVLGRLSVTYQPEPLNTIPAGNRTLRTALPHSGHSETGASLNFWKRSNRCLQARHSYSYVGMLLWKRVYRKE